jgi:hypothetical protein
MKTNLKNVLISASIVVLAASCGEDDTDFLIPIGETKEIQIDSSVYTHQTYFDLSTETKVLTVNNSDWDFEVETTGEMKVIKLNPAGAYRVFKTELTDITEDITLPEDPDWTYDDPSGETDELAFYDWKDNEVYVLARKIVTYDPTAPSIMPVAKVSFSHQSGGIEIKWVLDGETSVNNAVLPGTGSDRPSTWFSFKTQGKASVQPPKPDSYDLIITTYTGEVENGPISFDMELRGILTNMLNNTMSYRYEPGDATDEEYIEIFNNLTRDDIDMTEFDDDCDEIGHEWKKFNRNSMSYEIDKSNMYFIKDGAGNLFKIRFTNYYKEGVKGYITFTYALL